MKALADIADRRSGATRVHAGEIIEGRVPIVTTLIQFALACLGIGEIRQGKSVYPPMRTCVAQRDRHGELSLRRRVITDITQRLACRKYSEVV
jgi:hypothetical protein